MDNCIKAQTLDGSARDEKRHCALTEAKVNAGLILRVMLGAEEAMRYLIAAKVPKHVAIRVVMAPHMCRRLDAIADELRAYVSAAQGRSIA